MATQPNIIDGNIIPNSFLQYLTHPSTFIPEKPTTTLSSSPSSTEVKKPPVDNVVEEQLPASIPTSKSALSSASNSTSKLPPIKPQKDIISGYIVPAEYLSFLARSPRSVSPATHSSSSPDAVKATPKKKTSEEEEKEILAQLEILKAHERELLAAASESPTRPRTFPGGGGEGKEEGEGEGKTEDEREDEGGVGVWGGKEKDNSVQERVYLQALEKHVNSREQEMERERDERRKKEEKLRTEREEMENQLNAQRERLLATGVGREKDVVLAAAQAKREAAEAKLEEERRERDKVRERMQEMIDLKDKENMIEQRLRGILDTKLGMERGKNQVELQRATDLLNAKTTEAELQRRLRETTVENRAAMLTELAERTAHTNRHYEDTLAKERTHVGEALDALRSKEKELASLVKALSDQDKDLESFLAAAVAAEQIAATKEKEAADTRKAEQEVRAAVDAALKTIAEKEQVLKEQSEREKDVRERDAAVITSLQEKTGALERELAKGMERARMAQDKEQNQMKAVEARVARLEDELAERTEALHTLEHAHFAELEAVDSEHALFVAATEQGVQLNTDLAQYTEAAAQERRATEAGNEEVIRTQEEMRALEDKMKRVRAEVDQERGLIADLEKQLKDCIQKQKEQLEREKALQTPKTSEREEVVKVIITRDLSKARHDDGLLRRAEELQRRIHKEKEEVLERLAVISEEKQQQLQKPPKQRKVKVKASTTLTSPATTKGMFASTYASASPP